MHFDKFCFLKYYYFYSMQLYTLCMSSNYIYMCIWYNFPSDKDACIQVLTARSTDFGREGDRLNKTVKELQASFHEAKGIPSIALLG